MSLFDKIKSMTIKDAIELSIKGLEIAKTKTTEITGTIISHSLAKMEEIEKLTMSELANLSKESIHKLIEKGVIVINKATKETTINMSDLIKSKEFKDASIKPIATLGLIVGASMNAMVFPAFLGAKWVKDCNEIIEKNNIKRIQSNQIPIIQRTELSENEKDINH